MITNIINEVNHPQSFILFGEREDLEMFNELYKSIMKYMRKGWYVHHVIYNVHLFSRSLQLQLFGYYCQ